VVGYFGAKDVPGDNMIGPIMHDEEVFATDKVTCVGQVRLQVKLLWFASCLGRFCLLSLVIYWLVIYMFLAANKTRVTCYQVAGDWCSAVLVLPHSADLPY
jgi:hypothetical protein